MSTDVDLAETSWVEAVEVALLESEASHGLDVAALMDPDSDAGARFLEGLDDLTDSDPDDPAFARAVEAVARQFADDNPDLRVTEAIDLETVEGRVLEAKGNAPDGGKVFGVEILRYGDSKNGNRYTESVMRNAAPLYEGAKAYDHHRTAQELQTSTVQGLVGSYRNVRATDSALIGDLHLLPSQSHVAEALQASLDAQAAGRPSLVGISHDVQAEFKMPKYAGGRRVREAARITAVQSADVVADPSAGGRATHAIESTTPFGAEQTQESEVPVTTQDVLAALSSASEQQLAAHGLSRTGTTESVTPPERVVESAQRTTEAGSYSKASFLGRMLVKEKAEEAGISARVVEAALGDRYTEADVDRWIASYKDGLAAEEKAGLRPTATTSVTGDAHDKRIERLDATFEARNSKGYKSFREAFIDFTGKQPRIFDEDFARTIMRESAAPYDSYGRVTESMTSATWNTVLGDSITRRMVAEYEQPSLQTWRQVVSSIVPLNDFRTQRVERIGGYGTLPTVNQGAPYQPLTSPTNEEVTYAAAKRGATEDITMEMIANDDLGAIKRIPQKLGLAAAQTLFRYVWDIYNPGGSNAAIYDSVALYHASHANTASTALSQSNLSAARLAMRAQAAYGDTSDLLSLVPKLLVVVNDLEEIAFQLTSSGVAVPSTPAGPSNTPNLHQGMNYLVVDYWTSTTGWLAFADPNMCPTFELGFYQGREQPELFTQQDQTVGSMFNNDTLTYKVRHIYNGAVLDYRSVYRGNS